MCWIFVIIFQWGVTGAGLVTIFSQFLSVVIILFRLQQNDLTRLSLKDLRLRGNYAKDLLRIGLPTAVQQVTMSLAGTVVMGYVTSYGTESIAGYSVGSTIEMYVAMPVQALNMSVTPFAAQNVGAGKMDRVYQAAKETVMINSGINIVLTVSVLIFAEKLIGMFTDNAGTIAAGVVFLRIMVPAHIMTAINQPLSGVIRGSGNPITPMINALMMTVVIRIPIIILLNPIYNRIEVVYYSHVIATLYGLIHMLIVYRKGKWRQKAMARIEEKFSSGQAKEAF